MALAPGTRLGSYEVVASIGAGGMGEVYRARDSRLDRDVAVKILPAGLNADEESIDRFEREAKAVAALSHPSILAVYDMGRDAGVAYVVMELLEGQTLRERLNEGQLAPRKAVATALQLAEGLDAAHKKGIVNRDLKPENIFMTRDGRPKILDFGLAKIIRPDFDDDPDESHNAPTEARHTRAGMVLGTIGYMSPEQVRGKDVDSRTDIFSLGALLYEMLSGERAFAAETSADTMSAILREDPRALEDSGKTFTPALERIVRRCLEKDPEERFQSARDLRFALEALSDVGSDSDSQVGLEAAPAEASDSVSIAVLPFTDMSPAKDQDYFCEGIAEEILSELSRVEGLRVAARSSAFQFTGKGLDIKKVGSTLGVSKVLEGSVRTAGKRLRVSAQLINVQDGYQLWSERFDKEMEDVFAIQDEIAASIVAALQDELGDKTKSPGGSIHDRDAADAHKRYTANLEAYHLYLRGRHLWEDRAGGGPRAALPLFEEAVAKDPDYALAHAGIADCYSTLGAYGFAEPEKARSKASAAAARAVELDPHLPEAWVARGKVYFFFEWDWARMEKAFHRALELNPDYTPALVWCGLFQSGRGRYDEAVSLMRRAVELDPLSPFTHALAGSGFSAAKRPDLAFAAHQRALELDPNFLLAHRFIAFSYAQASRLDEAVASLEKVVELGHRGAVYVSDLGLAYGVSGRTADAERLLAELETRSESEYVSPVSVAYVLLGLGRDEEASARLQKAYEARLPGLPFSLWVPRSFGLEQNAVVRDFIERLGPTMFETESDG